MLRRRLQIYAVIPKNQNNPPKTSAPDLLEQANDCETFVFVKAQDNRFFVQNMGEKRAARDVFRDTAGSITRCIVGSAFGKLHAVDVQVAQQIERATRCACGVLK